jgi:hypothetical protein
MHLPIKEWGTADITAEETTRDQDGIVADMNVLVMGTGWGI